MIKYKLHITETGYPQIMIEDKYDYDKNGNYTFLSTEINNLSADKKYLNQIVKELEEVVGGKRNGAFFGYETMDLAVYKKGYNLGKDCKYPDNYNFPNGKVIITYNYNEDTLITDIKPEEILKMMTEWRDYINAWEKETGKIKH